MVQTKKQIGQRGKDAEGDVEDLLKRWNVERMEFAYERLPDARAARGVIKAQLSDYICMVGWTDGLGVLQKHFVILEVKETRHDYRLAKDKLEQLPRIHKWLRAHADGVVLVKHTLLNKWRAICATQLTIGLPSWDLRDMPLYDTPEQALVTFPAFRVFKRFA